MDGKEVFSEKYRAVNGWKKQAAVVKPIVPIVDWGVYLTKLRPVVLVYLLANRQTLELKLVLPVVGWQQRVLA